MFVKPARAICCSKRRQKFLTEQWPSIAATIQRLGITPKELLKAGKQRQKSAVGGQMGK